MARSSNFISALRNSRCLVTLPRILVRHILNELAVSSARMILITPGSVTPLGAIADAAGAVTIVLDASLASADRVNCHPLRNTATLGLSGADLVRALTHWGHPPVIVDVPAQD